MPSAETLIFGRPTYVALAGLHPTLPQIMLLWQQTFLNKFNPLVKLLNAPTVQNVIAEATVDLGYVTAATEALMSAVYLGAVDTIATIADEQCVRLLGGPRGPVCEHHPGLDAVPGMILVVPAPAPAQPSKQQTANKQLTQNTKPKVACRTNLDPQPP